MPDQKLNQVIAVEKGLKNRVETERTAHYHTLQKPALFNGMNKTYQPLKEDGDTVPPESKKVQQFATDILASVKTLMTELWDVTATKDYANCAATADVEIDGKMLVKDAPVTFLLFLEKEMVNVRTLINHVPTLAPDETWTQDTNSSLWKTEKTEKMRTQKVQKAIVMYPATVEHPAQTQLVSEDINVGTWIEQKLSSGIPESQKRAWLEKVDQVITAVKKARTAANMVPAPDKKVAKPVFDWVFGSGS